MRAVRVVIMLCTILQTSHRPAIHQKINTPIALRC